MKTKSAFLHAAAFSTAVLPALAASRPPSAVSENPNVILILADDQGWGQMSNMNHPYLRTPNMDRLKSESVSFSNFLVAPVCAPTRACLMTGRYNYRTGVSDTYQSRVNMWSDEKTVAEYLNDTGYATGLFGKWHLGYNSPLRPCDQGFDTYASWQEMQHSRQLPLIEEDGVFRYYPEFMSDVFCDKAIEFIQANRNQPFFCFYPLYLPHAHLDNMQVPEKYSKRFLQYEELTTQARDVYGMIEMADEELGRLLDAVDANGLRQNTVIIYVSDNGPSAQRSKGKHLELNNGLRGYKGSVYEGGMRVPFFVRWPGHVPAGTEVDFMANATDLLPTILDLCDATPAQWKRPLDGESILPLLLNPSTDSWNSNKVYCMHFFRKGVDSIRANMWENGCVREERYKLVNGDELYDLKNDPYEANNIADQMPDRVQSMRQTYQTWFSDVTGERGLVAAANGIGVPDQPVTYLYFFEKDQEVDPDGWPVEIVSEGNYTICIENLRHDMFGENVQCVLRCGDLTLKKPVDKNKVDLVFEGAPLPLGRYTFQIDFEGDVQQKTWRYGLADLGHRLVWIRKEK